MRNDRQSWMIEVDGDMVLEIYALEDGLLRIDCENMQSVQLRRSDALRLANLKLFEHVKLPCLWWSGESGQSDVVRTSSGVEINDVFLGLGGRHGFNHLADALRCAAGPSLLPVKNPLARLLAPIASRMVDRLSDDPDHGAANVEVEKLFDVLGREVKLIAMDHADADLPCDQCIEWQIPGIRAEEIISAECDYEEWNPDIGFSKRSSKRDVAARALDALCEKLEQAEQTGKDVTELREWLTEGLR